MPMGDVYSYDSAVANNSEDGLGATIQALEASLADLGGFVSKVTANWTGDEQVAYGGIQTRWDGASDEVKAILARIRVVLGETTQSVGSMRGKVMQTLQG